MKFHINAQGQPTVCRAEVRACPLDSEHYDSMREAMNAVNEHEFATQSRWVCNNTCAICGTDMSDNPWDGWCKPCSYREFAAYLSKSA